MNPNYRNPLFLELRDRLIDTSREERLSHAARAEQLLAELGPKTDHPYGFYYARITNLRPPQGDEAPIRAEDARHDVRKLVEDVWDSASVPLESVDERVLTIDDLTRMFNVSAKTISRWRDRGLVARRYTVKGRKQIGFPQSVVDRFVHRNRDRVSRGAKFRQLTEMEKHEIIELARRLIQQGESPSRTLTQVAAKTSRSVETVRYTIKRHDQVHGDRAILAGLESDGDAKIYSDYLRGATVAAIAKRNKRSEEDVLGVIREFRVLRVMELPLACVHSDEFENNNADELLTAQLPDAERKPRQVCPPAGLPAYLNSLYHTDLLTKPQEQHLFRRYNYRKFRVDLLRKQLDPTKACERLLDKIERLYEDAMVDKNHLIQANLRLVVSVAKQYVTTHVSLFDLISDGNVSLIKAVEKFDYGLGNKFSTYATWAIKKNYARTFSTHLRQQDRFRTCQDELLGGQAGYRADPLLCESIQTEYRSAVSGILGRLDEREQAVIEQRFGLATVREPRTLKEIGDNLGVSKERIRQIEARAMKKLRAAAREQRVELMVA
ncbi:MAG: sigma-70 family RNA polymerase sigma factor [Pirellulaceae bacterium]|jgi:RNA polymerase primary sigma factor/RNA polymerase sigma factor|nr:sigma-70 family RNA polymerase sigma factor [Pirellulaceae bacterium]